MYNMMHKTYHQAAQSTPRALTHTKRNRFSHFENGYARIHNTRDILYFYSNVRGDAVFPRGVVAQSSRPGDGAA